jgi:hypothetical protein
LIISFVSNSTFGVQFFKNFILAFTILKTIKNNLKKSHTQTNNSST